MATLYVFDWNGTLDQFRFPQKTLDAIHRKGDITVLWSGDASAFQKVQTTFACFKNFVPDFLDDIKDGQYGKNIQRVIFFDDRLCGMHRDDIDKFSEIYSNRFGFSVQIMDEQDMLNYMF
jgi:hypothetical protein